MVLRTRNSEQIRDENLLQKLKDGDNESFKVLYKTYYPMVENYIFRNNGSYDEAQETFQEIIVAFMEKLYDGFNLTSSLKTFLYSMMENNWLNKLRSKKRFENLKTEHYELPNEYNNEEDRNEMNSVLKNAYKELGDKCRQILILFYWKKHSMQEIAEKMNYTNSENAKNQKHKCLEKIRKIKRELNYDYR